MCFIIIDADELKQRILQILNAKDGEGERIGDLIVPKPTKPLGSLSSDPNSSGQSAMQSDISMIPVCIIILNYTILCEILILIIIVL